MQRRSLEVARQKLEPPIDDDDEATKYTLSADNTAHEFDVIG